MSESLVPDPEVLASEEVSSDLALEVAEKNNRNQNHNHNRDLKRKLFRGGVWNGIGKFSTVAMQMGSSVVLARLLFPDDFGTMALAYIFIQCSMFVSEFGFNLSIIQPKTLTPKYLSTVFWSSLAGSLAVMLLMIVISPFAAQWFNKPILQPILCVMSLIFPLGAIGRVSNCLLQRELRFKEIAIGDVLSVITFTVTTVTFALSGFGVWSFVGGRVAAPLCLAIYYQVVYFYRPSLEFGKAEFSEIFSLGRFLMGSNLISSLEKNYDSFLIGKFLGVTPLGYYGLAYNLIALPERQLAYMIGQVTMPAFSQIQDRPTDVFKGYLRTVELVAFITFPIYALMAITAPNLITLIYGSKWELAIFPLTVLSFTGAVNAISVSSGITLCGIGRSDLAFKFNLFRYLILLVTLPLGLKWGINGVALVYAANSLLLKIAAPVLIGHVTGQSWWHFLKVISPIALACAAMAIFRYLLEITGFLASLMLFSPWINGAITLGLSIIGGGIIYLTIMCWLNPGFMRELRHQLGALLKR